MFEDVKKDDRQIVSGPVPTEDMFADVDPTKDVQSTARQSISDATSVGGQARPTVSAAAVMKTSSESPIMKSEVGPAQPLRNLNDVMTDGQPVMVKPSIIKRLIIWLLSVALIVVVGWGGFWVYANFIAPAMNRPATGDTPTNTVSNTTTNQPSNNQPTTPTNTAPTQATIDTDTDQLPDVEEQLLGTDINSQDSDKDGLTDYEEVKIYGTDPLNPDTDNDGLTDREEVITWKTNPKNPDTDGDTFQDGMEVKNGFNPAGAGKIAPEQLPSNSVTQ